MSREILLSTQNFNFIDLTSLYDYSFRYTNIDYSGSYHQDRTEQRYIMQVLLPN